MATPTIVIGEDKGAYSEKDMLKELEAEKGLNSPDDDDDEEDDDEDDDSLVPDGGWGWVVCAASFMVNFILDGTMFSFGILLLELLDDLQETKAITSWVGSAQLGMSMMMGPVVSVLLKYFSIRQVTIAGTLISAVGFIASVFAPNIFVLIIMYGVVGGTGFSMVFLPAIIVVGLYFSKRRAIATGIATSGSGVGTFAYAYLCDQLLSIFTWRQTILILTGILLNCLACGMVFRPLVPLRRKRKSCRGGDSRSSSSSSSSSKGGDSSSSSTFYEYEDRETTAMVKKREGNTGASVKGESQSGDWLRQVPAGILEEAGKKLKDGKKISALAFCLHSPAQLNRSRHRHHRQHHHHPHDNNNPEAGAGPGLKSLLSPTLALDERLHRSVDDFSYQTITPKGPDHSEKVLYFSETELAPYSPHKEVPRGYQKEHITKGLMRPILRKDIYYSGSVSHLAEYQQCGRSMTSFLAQMTQPVSDDSGCSVSTEEEEESERGEQARGRWAKLCRGVVSWELFRSKAFLCLLVTFTMWTVQAVPVTYLPNLAVSKGVSHNQAAFLISIVGITNTAGRILAGVVTDVLRMRSIWLYVIALFVAAGVNYGIPWCENFGLLAFASAVFGVCMAVAVSMRTIVLAEQLGVEVLTQSFGVVALFQGLAFTVNPPIAGKLFDETGAYFWPFTMAGTMYLISAVFSLAVGLWFKPKPPPPAYIISVEEVVSESASDHSAVGKPSPSPVSPSMVSSHV